MILVVISSVVFYPIRTYFYIQKGVFLYSKGAFPKVLKGVVSKNFPGGFAPGPPSFLPPHFAAPHPTSLAPPLVLGVSNLAGGTTTDYTDDILKTVDNLMSDYSNYGLRATGARGHGMLEGTGARDEIWHGDTVARGHGKLVGTGARDEIWHGDTGARMARRACDLSDSIHTRSSGSLGSCRNTQKT